MKISCVCRCDLYVIGWLAGGTHVRFHSLVDGSSEVLTLSEIKLEH